MKEDIEEIPEGSRFPQTKILEPALEWISEGSRNRNIFISSLVLGVPSFSLTYISVIKEVFRKNSDNHDLYGRDIQLFNLWKKVSYKSLSNKKIHKRRIDWKVRQGGFF